MKPATQAAHFFLPDQGIIRVEPLGSGNVNDTYLIITDSGEQKVLQKINPTVFPDPSIVQGNLRLVGHHLKLKLSASSGPPRQFVPLLLESGPGGDSYQDSDGAVWRLVNYITGDILASITTEFQAEQLGCCLGTFHRLLASFDAKALGDSLPGFHDTTAYLRRYDLVAGKNNPPEKENVALCHNFIETHRSLATLLQEAEGLSTTAIHGDPKVANFIFDNQTRRAISLIDLDTVRRGLLLHDIGDGLRSCCNPLGESPPDPDKVRFDPDLFSAWLTGYTKEAEMLLTNADKAHIVQAVQVIALELGLRFFTDYLEGDNYFKISYPEHNLIRARVQFQLVSSLEEQRQQLETTVRSICK